MIAMNTIAFVELPLPHGKKTMQPGLSVLCCKSSARCNFCHGWNDILRTGEERHARRRFVSIVHRFDCSILLSVEFKRRRKWKVRHCLSSDSKLLAGALIK